MDRDIIETVRQLAKHAIALGWHVTGAESCTGGLIAAACTELPGSSAWFDRSWVVYSNDAKQAALGVPGHLLDVYGAVSEPVAAAMVAGAVQRSLARIGFAVTGIAGPTGGTAEKPVGTVCFGFYLGGHAWTETCHFSGDLAAVRCQSARHALQALVTALVQWRDDET